MALVGIDARFIYFDRWTGMSNYLYNLLSRMLTECSHRFRLYYESEPTRKPFPTNDRLDERKFTARGSRFHCWEQVGLPWHLHRDKVDLFHAPANYLPFLQPCPAVVTVHDMILSKFDEGESSNRLYYWRKLMPHCLRKAARIITVSECSKRDILSALRLDEHKVRVIYSGVDKFYRPLVEAERREQATQHPLPDQFVLLLGGASPRKNVTRAIEAFAWLKRRIDVRTKLVLTVPGEIQRREWNQKLEESGLGSEVVFLDYVTKDTLRYLYGQASLFLYPNLYEGFGMPLLEAMACGAPVASSNTSCMPEVAGDAAIFFDPLDPADMACSMEKTLTNTVLSAQLRDRGFERVKRFSWAKAATETLQVYEEVISDWQQ